MFRNTYLEMYKTSAAHQQSLPILISHFNQIYNTLGCVLQDLQFQVGKMLANQNNSQLHNKPDKSINLPINPKKNSKEVDKDIIKIEDSICGNFNAQPDDQKNSIKPKVNISINPGPPQSRKKFTADKWDVRGQSGGNEGQVMQKVRNQARENIGGDSFDSLFNPRNSNIKSPMEVESPSGFSSAKIAPMGQQPKEQAEPPADNNTYEDFLDRIFREQDSRNSR